MKLRVQVKQCNGLFSWGKEITEICELPEGYFPIAWILKMNEAKVRVIAYFEAKNKQEIRWEKVINTKPSIVEYIEISDKETGNVLISGEF